MDINSEQFLTSLRSALHYLYDPDQLRRSPLTGRFGLTGRMDAALALKTILLEAIEALRPGDQDPAQSREWLVYDVLFYRYVRGYSREAVANQLGMSDRQLSREQRTAIETLALRLWEAYPLEPGQELPPDDPPEETADAPELLPEASESAWVESLPADKSAPWKPILLSVLDLLHPLILQNEARVNVEPLDALPDLLAPQTALRHSLINLLGLAIPIARKGELSLTPSVSDQALSIQIEILPACDDPADLPSPVVSLTLHPNYEVARQLIERAGGSLALENSGRGARVRILVPALAQTLVLVVDDNPDMIQLFQRYVQGTRYAVAGLQSPAEAARTIEQVHPRIILMDLMMPEVDGWDLLLQIRQDYHLPILICSILPQAELARSLGADGFLQKPVLPQDFLNALDRLIDLPPHK